MNCLVKNHDAFGFPGGTGGIDEVGEITGMMSDE
jgi:hypothetical protein